MDLAKKLNTLESSSIFKEWEKEHPDAYMVHFFFMTGLDVQIGYYEESTDTITAFNMADKITKNPQSEVFKENNVVDKLDLNLVKISFEEVMDKAVALQKEKYNADTPTKDIVILQMINNKAVYNITFVTQTFKLINVRINAEDGELISESIKPLMDLAASVK
ncbi:hypothetical protein COV16_04400 [Candidatus Woesearchaeota archaeon CG10_big_fil_rev_8_21_14_0_10_34_8]|nr:MAG: hypothetical protein COV16_04400 [Candidatus Woesearchaeota archaeon CG10_big_fil_rev_8_21_14_0_10_34_8]